MDLGVMKRESGGIPASRARQLTMKQGAGNTGQTKAGPPARTRTGPGPTPAPLILPELHGSQDGKGSHDSTPPGSTENNNVGLGSPGALRKRASELLTSKLQRYNESPTNIRRSAGVELIQRLQTGSGPKVGTGGVPTPTPPATLKGSPVGRKPSTKSQEDDGSLWPSPSLVDDDGDRVSQARTMRLTQVGASASSSLADENHDRVSHARAVRVPRVGVSSSLVEDSADRVSHARSLQVPRVGASASLADDSADRVSHARPRPVLRKRSTLAVFELGQLKGRGSSDQSQTDVLVPEDSFTSLSATLSPQASTSCFTADRLLAGKEAGQGGDGYGRAARLSIVFSDEKGTPLPTRSSLGFDHLDVNESVGPTGRTKSLGDLETKLLKLRMSDDGEDERSSRPRFPGVNRGDVGMTHSGLSTGARKGVSRTVSRLMPCHNTDPLDNGGDRAGTPQGGSASGGRSIQKQMSIAPERTNVKSVGVSVKVLENMLQDVGPNMSTQEVVDGRIKSAVQQRSCCYTELLPSEQVGRPQFYITHSWKGNFGDMVKAITRYLGSKTPKLDFDNTFVWIDILCANQLCNPFSSDPAVHSKIIDACSHTLAIVDRGAAVYSQTECLWEMWCTLNLTKSDRAKLIILHSSWYFDETEAGYVLLDPKTSKANDAGKRSVMMNDLTRQPLSNTIDLMMRQLKRELAKSESAINTNPMWYLVVSCNLALLQSLNYRYSDCEDTLNALENVLARATAGAVSDSERLYVKYLISWSLKEKGMYNDAERICQAALFNLKAAEDDDLYHEMMSFAADMLFLDGHMSKCEILSRRAVDAVEKKHGKESPLYLRFLLRLAALGARMKLTRQAELGADEAMDVCISIHGAKDNLDMAETLRIQAMCALNSRQPKQAITLLEESQEMRLKLLDPAHPEVLSLQLLIANIRMDEEEVETAEEELRQANKYLIKTRGIDHHLTLQAMGLLADVCRDLDKDAEAAMIEKKLIETGQKLVKTPKPLDVYRSVTHLCTYLAERDHLVDKASTLMGNVFVVYRQKLGPEHRLTKLVLQKLCQVIDRMSNLATDMLTEASSKVNDEMTMRFHLAEEIFRQALSIRLLVLPEENHSTVVRGLSEALFGQGKIRDAQQVLKDGNVPKVTSLDAMPTAYLKFLNTRVAKYMDKRRQQNQHMDPESEEGVEEACGS